MPTVEMERALGRTGLLLRLLETALHGGGSWESEICGSLAPLTLSLEGMTATFSTPMVKVVAGQVDLPIWHVGSGGRVLLWSFVLQVPYSGAFTLSAMVELPEGVSSYS
jgi:hypothetical protein